MIKPRPSWHKNINPKFKDLLNSDNLNNPGLMKNMICIKWLQEVRGHNYNNFCFVNYKYILSYESNDNHF